MTEDKKQKYEKLVKEHRELDTKVAEMLSKPYLLPDEQIEVNRLKKLKLKLKEEIYLLKEELDSKFIG